MVKVFFSLLVLFSLSYSEDAQIVEDSLVVEDPVVSKIKSFLDTQAYEENVDFINVIFDPKSDFYKNERVDSVKVVETLKENGLLELFFKTPRELTLNFKTSGSPLFFVKLMGDTLRSMGYYRYVTTASHLDASEFTWNINLTSEYATDPLILETELNKSGCKIIDVERSSQTQWTYIIDMDSGFLNIKELKSNEELNLKRSLYAHWLNVSQVNSVTIKSSRRNRWYPYIAYYDASLHLLKVVKSSEITQEIDLDIPQGSKYIKISDLYTLKNVRDELVIYPVGFR
ncbi:MAG: hypothetical protein U9O86_09570 [Campylobacterota bacterium]|nr:hypothetical protein [Campylobacterota bacterium]